MKSLPCVLLAAILAAFTHRSVADPLDDALGRIGCTRSDLAIPTDIRWRDPFRLEVIDRLLAGPLQTPDYCQTLAEELANADSLETVIARAASRLEWGELQSSWPPAPSSSSLNLGALKPWPEVAEALQILYQGAAAAESERRRAFATLSRAEYSHLLRYHTNLVRHIRGSENTIPFDETLLAAARKVDYACLARAAMLVARATEAAEKILRDWKGTGETAAGKKPDRSTPLLDQQTPLGRVVVGGPGDNHYDGKPIAILIEPGGNDTYRCRVGAGIESVSVVVDLLGDDRYETESPFAFGSGALGVGILLDCDGDDSYVAADAALGSAVVGVGALVDRAGMDFYSVDEHGQAAANFGIGLLVDEGGADTYLARYFSQAVSGPLGFGLLLERGGDDTYFTGGKHHGWSSSETAYRSACQGFSQGIREYASGGIALLVDVAGNDAYRGGAICQGVGYWFGLGALVDGAGDDHYTCLHYGQGGPFHFAVGALLDNGGHDTYRGDVAALGLGYDWSAGFLVDYAGQDQYAGQHLALGAGGANGVGIFCDNAGDDRYHARGSFTLGSGQYTEKRAAGSIGVFLDFDGDDHYPGPPYGNENSWTQQFYGVGCDWKGGTPLFTRTMQIQPRPALHIASKVDPIRIVPEVPYTLAGARELFEIMVDGYGATPRARKAQEEFLKRPQHALPVLMENLVQKPFYRCYGLAYSLLPRFGAAAVTPLLDLARNTDPWLRCRAADVLGMLRPEEAAPALPVLRAGLRDEHGLMRTSCVMALGELGDSESIPALMELLASDPVASVRMRAAEALGKLKAAEADSALRGATADPYYHVRQAAQRALEALTATAENK